MGANVAGLLRSELGIGQGARSVIEALDAAGVPVLPLHGRHLPAAGQSREFACLTPGSARFPVNILSLNPDELDALLLEVGPGLRAGRHTIGYWWWEGSRFPPRWRGAFDGVDEVWTGSEHVASLIRAAAPGRIPVHKLPIPVYRPAADRLAPAPPGLPSGFVFLFMFDFHSDFERKNPLAAVAAFRLAFPPGSGASLVLKCVNQGSDPGGYARLLGAVSGHADIHVLAHYLAPSARDALLGACDCYVSLHRAEGFGLTIAEAMALGKPAIATGWSGNLEFMTERNSYPVAYEMVPIGNAGPLYATGDGEWAAPDLDDAARLMRHVFEHREEARARGAAAAADIEGCFSAQACGRRMRGRLEQIAAARGRVSAPPPRQLAPRPRRLRPFSDVAEGWRLAIRKVALWQAVGAMRATRASERRRLLAGMVGAAGELIRDWSRRRALGRDRVRLAGADELEVSGLLSQLRSHEAALRDLEARLARLEESGHRVGSPRNRP